MDIPDKITNVLHKLKLTRSTLLGKGGEGYIFSYTPETVIKIYNNTNKQYLDELAKLQSFIASKNLPFSAPLIQEIGEVEGTYYNIEKKLSGVVMEKQFPTVSLKEQFYMLKSYHEALKALSSIELPNLPYGSIIHSSLYPLTDSTWQGFVTRMVKQRVELKGERLRKDVNNLEQKVQQYEEVVKKELYINKKYLVHADYFVNQVLVNEKNEISAVLDIGIHAIAGDRRLDAACITFFGLHGDYLPEHINYLLGLEIEDYGESIRKFNDIYNIYYCFYFSDIYDFNPHTYQEIVKTLNDEALWKRIS